MKILLAIMMFILLFAPADAYSFEKMNGNHLVLLTSQEAYDLNKNEQNTLIKKRAMNVCRLLDKELLDYSVEKIKEEFIPEKTKRNLGKHKIYKEDVQHYKLPEDNMLAPVSEQDLIVEYNVLKASIQILSYGFLPITRFGYAVVVKDITCVDKKEYVLE